MIFGVLLPFVAIALVGGLLTLLLIRRGIGEVKGLWQTTGSKNPSGLSRKELPAPELKTPYKPSEQRAPEKDLSANTNEENASHGNLWRW